MTYKIYNAFWILGTSGTNVAVDKTTGLVNSLASLNTKTIHFQMGNDWNVGLGSLTCTTLIPRLPFLHRSGFGALVLLRGPAGQASRTKFQAGSKMIAAMCERVGHCHRIDNLTLAPPPLNALMRKDPFSAKKQRYKNTASRWQMLRQ